VDPCDSTELITQSIDTLTTDNGVVGTVDFNDVNDTHEVSKGLYSLCGPRTYSIAYQNDDPITWVTVAESSTTDVWTITADPTLDEHERTHNLKL